MADLDEPVSNSTFTIDTAYPLISYGIGTADDGANLSQSNIYINTTWTELNFKNITYHITNTTYSESAIYISSSYSNNFTSSFLVNGLWYYNVTLCDLANNCNTTATRTITLDTENPNATLLTPADSLITATASQNLTVNLTDNLGIKNVSLYINNVLNSTITFASNVISATVGVVKLVKLDPRNEGSTTRGLFRFARPQMGFTVAT